MFCISNDLSLSRPRVSLAQHSGSETEHVNGRVVVVGAGIAGLTAAHRLRGQGLAVTVLEAGDAIGGRMSTVERDGYLLDVGALAVSRKYTQMTALAAEVGIGDRIVDSSETIGIVHEGVVHRLRSSAPLDAARTGLVSWSTKLRAARVGLDLHRLSRVLDWDDVGAAGFFDRETVREWIGRRAGLELDDRITGPLLRGSVMADSSDLSALELGYIALNFFGSKVFTFAGGLGALPTALAGRLDVRLGTRAAEIEERPGEVLVTAIGPAGEELLFADACVIALSAHDMAAIHPGLPAAHREIVERAGYVRLMPIQLALTARPQEESLYLSLPEAASRDLCSIYFDHNKHHDRAPAGCGLLTLFWHDRWARAHWDDPDDDIVARTVEEASRWVPGLEDAVAFGHVTRWPAGVMLSRPGTYSRLHEIARARAGARRVHLAGDYFGGSTTNAALCSGECAARHVVASLNAGTSAAGRSMAAAASAHREEIR